MTLIDTRPPTARSRRRRPPKVRARDFRHAYLYGLAALAVRVLPPSRWETAARWIDAVDYGERGKRAQKFERYRAGFRAVHSDTVAEKEIRRLFDSAALLGRRADLYLAAYRRAAGLSPKIDIVGMEHVEEALGRGRGTILWFDNFPLSSIPGKRAFAEAGHPIFYLSGYAHGFSYTRFANHLLNWRLIDLERRYLAARILFSEDSVLSATKTIVALLAENRIVGIANNAVMGKTINVPFAGRASLKIAPTPLNIAAKRGAALLPVAVIEAEPFRRFEVTIGPDLRRTTRVGEDSVEAMASAYAAYLLPLARAHPDKWDWGALSLPPKSGAAAEAR
jgi:lauroyl/myristoyl acyltransferase